MVKPKKRNNKNRPITSTTTTSARLLQQHPMQFTSRTEFDQEDSSMHPSSSSSPFQPLNKFFNRSRNPRYAAIPELNAPQVSFFFFFYIFLVFFFFVSTYAFLFPFVKQEGLFFLRTLYFFCFFFLLD